MPGMLWPMLVWSILGKGEEDLGGWLWVLSLKFEASEGPQDVLIER